MGKSKQEIIEDIKNLIKKGGGPFIMWYVGISKDVSARLAQHGITEKDAWYICRKAESSTIAREIEEYFVEFFGTNGFSGGGDKTADIVYAYKKEPHTNP